MDHFEKQEAGYLPATYEDLANAITDEHGTKYSPDGKRLLQGADIKAYAIKDGTEIICDQAFEYCTSLRQIYIPGSVTSIGHSAFWSCKSLKQINIPDGVTSIGDGAFERCKSLRQINIPDSVTSIGGGAFWGCKSLEQINIPDGVTSIGKTFWGCKSLEQITIPSSVSAIEGNPFVGCTCTITCHSPHFKVVGNVLYNSDLTKLISCLSTQSHFTIPDNVTSIGDSAFEGCSSLRQINIPNSVTSIKFDAFRDCSSLRQINIPAGSREKFEEMLPDERHMLVEAGD